MLWQTAPLPDTREWVAAPLQGQCHCDWRVSFLTQWRIVSFLSVLVMYWQSATPVKLLCCPSWIERERLFLFFSFVLLINFSSKLIQITAIVRIGDLLLRPPLCSSWDIQVKVPFTKARPWATFMPGLEAHFFAWCICVCLKILGFVWISISISVSGYRKEYCLVWNWGGVTEL